MPGVEDRFDSLKGCCAVGPGKVLAGLGQDVPMPEAFSLCQLKPVPIPEGKDGDHGTNEYYYRKCSNGLGAVSAEELAQAIRCAGASGDDRLMFQMPPDVESRCG